MDNMDSKKISQVELEEYKLIATMLSKSVHDMNNPLSVIIGQLSIIEALEQAGKMTPEKFQKIMGIFKSSADRFRIRLDELRAFYKIVQDDNKFNNLSQVLCSVSYLFENECYVSEIHLQTELEEDLPIEFGRDKLFLIFKSLVKNSIESIQKKDSGEKLITIKNFQDNPKIIMLEDTGTDFPGDLISNQHADSDADDKLGRGTAVVLTLCKELNIKINYSHNTTNIITLELP